MSTQKEQAKSKSADPSELAGLSRREASKQKRRDRILSATAELICAEGIDEVRLATVAKMADVTVPTIHNLFGKKNDIFVLIIQKVGEELISLSKSVSKTFSLTSLEEGVEELFDLLERKEQLFKAGFIVGERLSFLGLEEQSFRYAANQVLKQRGDLIEKEIGLNGKVDLMGMSELMMDRYRTLRSDWVKGKLSSCLLYTSPSPRDA